MDLETRTVEQLPGAATAEYDHLIAIQAPGGPLAKMSLGTLIGKIGPSDLVVEIADDLTLAYDAGTRAIVYADPDIAKIGYHIKVGASGAGSWLVTRLFEGRRGNPGGNVMAVGLFVDLGDISVPDGAELVQTSGHGRLGVGIARYKVGPATDAVAPETAYSTNTDNGRPVYLAETLPSAEMFGILADDAADNASELQDYVDWCRDNREIVRLPAGVIRTSVAITTYGDEDTGSTTMIGAGEYETIIRQMTAGQAVLTNDQTVEDFRRLTLRGLTLRGGRWGLRIIRTGSQVASLIHCGNVRFELQSDEAIRNDQYLISSCFDNVVFYYCNSALYNGRNANNVTFIKARFEGLDDDIIELASPGGAVNGSENFRMIDPRIEGRNAPGITGKIVLKGYRLDVTIDGGYIEDTHKIILAATGVVGTVRFNKTHFTGQENGVGGTGFKQEEFVSASLVVFDGCNFVTGTAGAAKMLVLGGATGVRDDVHGSYRSMGRSFIFAARRLTGLANNTAVDLLKIMRPAPGGIDEPVGGLNQRSTKAVLEILVQAKQTGGGRAFWGAEIPVLVSAYATENIKIVLGTPVPIEDDGDNILTVAVAEKAGATQTAGILQVTPTISADFESVSVTATLTGMHNRGAASTYLDFE